MKRWLKPGLISLSVLLAFVLVAISSYELGVNHAVGQTDAASRSAVSAFPQQSGLQAVSSSSPVSSGAASFPVWKDTDLYKIMEYLNKEGNSLQPREAFQPLTLSAPAFCRQAAGSPLSLNGTSEAVSAAVRFLEGQYRTGNGLFVTVRIVPDKAWENGGLIYYNNIQKNNDAVYKYGDTYLLFFFSYDLNDGNNAWYTQGFLRDFYFAYRDAYHVAVSRA